MSLRQELQEFVNEVSGKLHPDEPLNVQIHHAVREFFDVVGVCLQANANVDQLSNEAVEAARQLIPKLNIGPVAKRIADAAASFVIPPIVEQLAQYTGRGQEFLSEHVLPRLDLWIETLQDVRGDLTPPGVIPE